MEVERRIESARELFHRQRRERGQQWCWWRKRNEARRKQRQEVEDRDLTGDGGMDHTIVTRGWGHPSDDGRVRGNVCDPLRSDNDDDDDHPATGRTGAAPLRSCECPERWRSSGGSEEHEFTDEERTPTSWRSSRRKRAAVDGWCPWNRVTGGPPRGRGRSCPWLLALTSAMFVLLAVSLPCAIAVAPKYETAYACEGKTLMIECEHGDLINLIRANYGRFSITICNDHGNVDWSVNCMSPKSLRVLHSKCAQKQNCSVLASTTMFGDPCPGTHKYLEAHYQCVSAAQSSTTTNRPSPPWLKTSQPIVWSTSTVRNPVLSRLNLTNELGGADAPFGATTPKPTASTVTATSMVAGVTAAVSSGVATVRPGGGKTNQPSTTFRNKGFENKSVNDDLAIIKTITDRKKGSSSSVGSPAATGPAAAGGTVPAPATEDEEDGADLYPTQTAVLSGAAAPGVARSPSGSSSTGATSINVGGAGVGLNNHNPNVLIDVSHACGPSTARNLFWNITRVGEVNVQPCPGGATGIAKWRCVAIASLTPEQRVHLQQEHQQMLQLQHQHTHHHHQQQQQAATAAVVSSEDAGSSNKGDISFNSNTGAPVLGAIGATWYAYQPDLTQCRSLWLNNLEVRVQQPESSLILIANDLAQVTSSKTLYGGDMLVATKIIQTMSQKMHYDIETIPDQRQREALVFELLNSVVKTGSNLLDQSQHASWLDLSVEDQMRVATSLLTGLEDNAFLLADTILREKHVVQKVKNILISIRVLETRNFAKATELFPDSSTERWQVSSDQIELPKAALIENSEGGLVRIVFVAFDRLEQILRPQFSNIQQQQQHQQPLPGGTGPRAESSQHQLDTEGIASANVGVGGDGRILTDSPASGTRTDSPDSRGEELGSTPRLRLLNSKVISASLGKGRHIQLSQPIRMVLRHLRTKNVSNPTCVFWNYIDHAWSEDGCHVEHTNQTHTVCMCNHLTNFALLVDAVDDETQLSLLSNIDDSMLIYIGVAIVVVIVVVALFARKLCHGSVLAKLRNGGDEGAMRAAGVVPDRDGGLSISGHHAVGARMHHHHNNAGVDLHHPTVPSAVAAHHHHHLVHHHLPGLAGAPGHHLLVADDFHQQQQPANNLHNHHPNNLVTNNIGHGHHVGSNNLVTTTFNNLNGGGGSGMSSCSPSPPGLGGGYEHHLPAHLGRLNNNPINSSNNNSSSNSSSSTNLHHLHHHQQQQQQPPVPPVPHHHHHHHLPQSSFSSNNSSSTTTTSRKLPQPPPLVPSSYKGSVVAAGSSPVAHHQHHL